MNHKEIQVLGSHEPHALYRMSSRVFNAPLMIESRKADQIAAVLGSRMGISVPNPTAGALDNRMDRKPYAVSDAGIAVIDVAGSLANRSTGLEAWSGMSTYEQISYEVEDAATDPAIKAVLLRCDSPGGEVHGAFDCADIIRSVRGIKPIWASVDDCACSAAYLLASACEKVAVTVTSDIGSIGVIAMHVEQSGFDKEIGLKYTTLFAGAHKNDFSPHEPLTDDAKAGLQAEIDRMYGMFVGAVAKSRGLGAEAIRATEAKVFNGPDAVKAKLADQVSTYRDTLAALTEVVRASSAPQTSTAASAATQPKQEKAMDPKKLADAALETKSEEETDKKKPEAIAPGDDKEKDKDEEVKGKEAASVKPDVNAAADPELVIDMVAMANQPASLASELIKGKLTLAAVREKLLSMRAAGEQNLRSGVSPSSGGAMSQIGKAAMSANDPNLTAEQNFARALRANPSMYSQYLAEHPAQTGHRA